MMNQQLALFMNMLKTGNNPGAIIMQMLQQQQSNPVMQNLFTLAQQRNTTEMEKIARNLCLQRGIDFDKEFRTFRQQLGF